MGTVKPLIIYATWDEEAKVWVATSEDVPGLATEAENQSELIKKLKTMITELLDENGCSDGDEIAFRLLSECTAVAYRHTTT